MVNVDAIMKIIQKNDIKIDIKDIDKDENLREQGIDSLDFTSILFAIEEEYNVQITEDDIQEGKLDTINSIITFVNERTTN